MEINRRKTDAFTRLCLAFERGIGLNVVVRSYRVQDSVMFLVGPTVNNASASCRLSPSVRVEEKTRVLRKTKSRGSRGRWKVESCCCCLHIEEYERPEDAAANAAVAMSELQRSQTPIVSPSYPPLHLSKAESGRLQRGNEIPPMFRRRYNSNVGFL